MASHIHRKGSDGRMNRSIGTLFAGMVVGAALGYFMTLNNGRAQRIMSNQADQMAKMARRTASMMQSGAQRLNPAMKAGRTMVSAAMRSLR